MEQKRAWIYCRVAHNGPDSAETLAAQRSRLEAYACLLYTSPSPRDP